MGFAIAQAPAPPPAAPVEAPVAETPLGPFQPPVAPGPNGLPADKTGEPAAEAPQETQEPSPGGSAAFPADQEIPIRE